MDEYRQRKAKRRAEYEAKLLARSPFKKIRVVCEACNGSGYYDYGGKKCSSCRGKGLYRRRQHQADEKPADMKTVREIRRHHA